MKQLLWLLYGFGLGCFWMATVLVEHSDQVMKNMLTGAVMCSIIPAVYFLCVAFAPFMFDDDPRHQ